ncbi:MAG TPA: hypothetical protein PKH39_00685 [Woeseiaceae bacterium]|nr:hypothetical protein [Woeseiaceae bacterium]
MNPRPLLLLKVAAITVTFAVCAASLAARAAVAEQNGETGNVVLEKMRMDSGDPETVSLTFEKLIGTWHQSPDNFSEAGKAWMLENKISGFYDSFSWGTNKAWIDFGDFRIVDGEPEKTGVGMISWHTGFKHMRFRESGARGGLVEGMIEIRDDNTFVRHYEFFSPDGRVSYHSDTWSFDPENPTCFSWQSTAWEDGGPKHHPARLFCKK